MKLCNNVYCFNLMRPKLLFYMLEFMDSFFFAEYKDHKNY